MYTQSWRNMRIGSRTVMIPYAKVARESSCGMRMPMALMAAMVDAMRPKMTMLPSVPNTMTAMTSAVRRRLSW